MKKTEMLNADISSVIASMGHTDMLAIGDAGLPIPDSVKRIDLALKRGIPAFWDVLETVLLELEVEEVTIASEMLTENSELYEKIVKRFADVKINQMPHADLKRKTNDCRAVIRTGECIPFANIILHSGVAF